MTRMDEQVRDEMVERITRVGMMLEDLSAKALGAAALDEVGLRKLKDGVADELRKALREVRGVRRPARP